MLDWRFSLLRFCNPIINLWYQLSFLCHWMCDLIASRTTCLERVSKMLARIMLILFILRQCCCTSVKRWNSVNDRLQQRIQSWSFFRNHGISVSELNHIWWPEAHLRKYRKIPCSPPLKPPFYLPTTFVLQVYRENISQYMPNFFLCHNTWCLSS